MDFQNPYLALGSLGEETGEAVGRGEELEESWAVPSFRSCKLEFQRQGYFTSEEIVVKVK